MTHSWGCLCVLKEHHDLTSIACGTASQVRFITLVSSAVTSFQTNLPGAEVGFVKMQTVQLVKKPLERGFGLEVGELTS